MAIKEKPRDLEFTCCDDNDNPIFDVKFLKESKRISLTSIDGSISSMEVPAEVMGEIVDFLREQNVIKGGVPKKPMSFSESLLPLPVIEIKDGASSIIVSANQFPVSSFDIKGETSDGKKEEVPIETTTQPKEPTVTKKADGGIVIDNSSQSDSNIPKRAVIRTRIRDTDDPLGAEKEAAAMRGAGDGAKEIKRY